MIRTFILAGIALITLSQCDSGPNAGAPKQKTVVVQKKSKTETSTDTKNTEGASSMSSEQVKKAQSLISSATNIEGIDAKKIFKSSCAICHGFKGNLGINGAKDLTASTINLKEAVAQVYFGKGLMTPFKGVLTDDEIVAVSKYTEGLRKK